MTPCTVILTANLYIAIFGQITPTGQGVAASARRVVPGATAISCQPKTGMIAGGAPSGGKGIGVTGKGPPVATCPGATIGVAGCEAPPCAPGAPCGAP